MDILTHHPCAFLNVKFALCGYNDNWIQDGKTLKDVDHKGAPNIFHLSLLGIFQVVHRPNGIIILLPIHRNRYDKSSEKEQAT